MFSFTMRVALALQLPLVCHNTTAHDAAWAALGVAVRQLTAAPLRVLPGGGHGLLDESEAYDVVPQLLAAHSIHGVRGDFAGGGSGWADASVMLDTSRLFLRLVPSLTYVPSDLCWLACVFAGPRWPECLIFIVCLPAHTHDRPLVLMLCSAHALLCARHVSVAAARANQRVNPSMRIGRGGKGGGGGSSTQLWPPLPVKPPPHQRKIRVGLVSGLFREHAVGGA